MKINDQKVGRREIEVLINLIDFVQGNHPSWLNEDDTQRADMLREALRIELT